MVQIMVCRIEIEFGSDSISELHSTCTLQFSIRRHGLIVCQMKIQ
jgi:hypothetical protein